MEYAQVTAPGRRGAAAGRHTVRATPEEVPMSSPRAAPGGVSAGSVVGLAAMAAAAAVALGPQWTWVGHLPGAAWLIADGGRGGWLTPAGIGFAVGSAVLIRLTAALTRAARSGKDNRPMAGTDAQAVAWAPRPGGNAVPAWVVTAILAGATAIIVPIGFALTSVRQVATLPLAWVLAGLILLRNRWPVFALLASIANIAALHSSGMVDTGWIWPATVVYASAVLAGRAGWAVGIGVTYLTYAANWELYVAGHDLYLVIGRIGGEALWLGVVLAAAAAYRNRQRWQYEVAARLTQSLHERELETSRRRAEERVRIARELHDVVSHTLAVVGVHLNVALDAVRSAPHEAVEALQLAQDVRGRAMADLRALVELLRDDAGAGIEAPVALLDGVSTVVDQVRAAGLLVLLDEHGDPAAVPAPVAVAAYRIAQEALTNTVRHANATRAVVSLDCGPDRVTVTVTDDGTGGAPESAGGHGIAGMRERVEALGGSFAAGPTGAGFRVSARIPVRGLR
jgi:signal transduction histidine kinase